LPEVDITNLVPVRAKDRVLLLPHCLRRTGTCRAKYNSHGLICAGCTQDCPVNRLSSAAVKKGYKGVCVAPGGRLAVNYINEIRPEAIVAIACEKELEEGIGNVSGIDGEGYSPVIVIIPLSKDGCVDTEVDFDSALSAINAGLEK
jgi:uncharacterized protein